MTNTYLYKIAGTSSILAALLILAANFGGQFMEVADGISSFDPAESLKAVVETPNPLLYSGWLNIYGAIATAFAVIGIYWLMRKVGPHALIPLVIMQIGLVILSISYLVALAAPYQLGPLLTDGASKDAVFGAEYLRKMIFEITVVFASWLTLGVSMALFGLFGLRSSNIPKWISWVALVGGVVGIEEWLKPYPWQTDRTALVIINMVAFAVWIIGMGVVLLRAKDDVSNTS